MNKLLDMKITGLLKRKEATNKKVKDTLAAANLICRLKENYPGSEQEIIAVYKILSKEADNSLREEQQLEEIINYLLDDEEDKKRRPLFNFHKEHTSYRATV